jgi:hypothetical protein
MALAMRAGSCIIRRMRRLITSAFAPLSFALLFACSGSDDDGLDLGPDAGSGIGNVDAGGGTDAAVGDDADIPPDATAPDDADIPPDGEIEIPDFDHFRFVFDPETPRAGIPFTLEIHAYASEDDSEPLVEYEGPASVTASAGELSGDTESQVFVDGVATLTLTFAAPIDDVTLTVTDDADAEITGTTESFDVLPEGDVADLRDVVINEVNWFGNGDDSLDSWIELRNTTDRELNLTGWSIDNAGIGSNNVVLGSGTTIAPGGYLVVADRQGPDVDGERTALTGLDNVVVTTVRLANGGLELILRDRDGEVVDRTPDASPSNVSWAAGHNGVDFLMSMERRDDSTGGGYGDGSIDSEWYTWNEADGIDTTHPDTRDRGTPGADNTDPSAGFVPDTLPYATSFEPGQRAFRLTSSTGAQLNDPPPGTSARTGSHVLSTSDLTAGQLNGRRLQSADCIALRNGEDDLVVDVFAVASSENESSVIRIRHVIEWYTDDRCLEQHPDGDGELRGTNFTLSTDYARVRQVVSGGQIPDGATHIRLSLEPHRQSGTGNGWAADDLTADQIPAD